jgi:NAD-dependent deacetylase
VEQLCIDDQTYLLVLTGAGVSAESGVPTFRDNDGLWEKYDFEEVATSEGFARNPALVWHFTSLRRAHAATVKPNPGHEALVEWERRMGDRFLLATQNTDGLHRVAGSQRMVEMHGALFTSRCTACKRPPFEDRTAYPEGTVPMCDQCGEKLRPHVVMFGELLEAANVKRIQDFVQTALSNKGRLVFLAAGTSGVVFPASKLVDEVWARGGKTWLVNLEPAANAENFDHFIQGKSGEVLPQLARFE